MANKFTKSVLERQAKEAKDSRLHPKTTPAPTLSAEPKPLDVPSVETKTKEEKPKRTLQPVQTPPVSGSSKSAGRSKRSGQLDLSSFIIRDHERSAKNKTFYLDSSVIHAVKAAASAQKVTDSKLVNDILKKILNVE